MRAGVNYHARNPEGGDDQPCTVKVHFRFYLWYTCVLLILSAALGALAVLVLGGPLGTFQRHSLMRYLALLCAALALPGHAALYPRAQIARARGPDHWAVTWRSDRAPNARDNPSILQPSLAQETNATSPTTVSTTRAQSTDLIETNPEILVSPSRSTDKTDSVEVEGPPTSDPSPNLIPSATYTTSTWASSAQSTRLIELIDEMCEAVKSDALYALRSNQDPTNDTELADGIGMSFWGAK